MLEPVELRMHRDHDTVNRACGSLVPLKPLIINKNFGVVLEMDRPALHPSAKNRDATSIFFRDLLHQKVIESFKNLIYTFC